jgi:hypothetical protein
MLLPSKALNLASLITHSSLTNKIAIGIVTGAAVIVAIGVLYSSPESPNPVDASSVMATASPISNSSSKLRFTDTDPTGNMARHPREDVPGMSPQESKEVEANRVNGHIQAF